MMSGAICMEPVRSRNRCGVSIYTLRLLVMSGRLTKGTVSKCLHTAGEGCSTELCAETAETSVECLA